MQNSNRKTMVVGILAGIGLTGFAGLLMGQGASAPVKIEPQFFVTGEGDHAHLWVREGVKLRVVGHGECKDGCPWDKHEAGDGHDHKDAKK